MTSTRQLLALAAAVALLATMGGCGIGDAQARLRTAIDARKPALDDCYGSTLKRDKTAAGDMQLVVHVDEEQGQVTQIEMTRADIKDAALQQCVQRSLVGTRIDPGPNANLKVEYTLRFTPTS